MSRYSKDLEKEFEVIRQRMTFLGLSMEHVGQLNSFSKLQTNSHEKQLCKFTVWTNFLCGMQFKHRVLSVIVLLVSIIVAFGWSSGIARKLFSVYEDGMHDICLIEFPEKLFDWTRPPVLDCSICQGIKQVDRVSNLSPSVFEVKYAYTGVPVVVTDGAFNWTAQKHFNIDFFKKLYSEDSLANSESNCQFFPWKGEYESLADFFESADIENQNETEPWYIGWSNCDPAASSILRQYYEKPYFLSSVSESSNTDWIFMGSPGFGAPLHIDNVGNPSWQAQIVGSKLWTFEPQPECYFQCEKQLNVLVNPGEVIVLDANRWFHATKITGEDISIVIGSEYD